MLTRKETKRKGSSILTIRQPCLTLSSPASPLLTQTHVLLLFPVVTVRLVDPMLVVQGHGRDRGQRDSLVSGSEEDVKVGDLAGYDGRCKGRRSSGDEGTRVE